MEIVMTKLDGVGDKERFGVGVNYLETTIMVKRGTNVKSVTSTKSPRSPLVGFVVDDDWASTWTDWSGIKVEGFTSQIFPG